MEDAEIGLLQFYIKQWDNPEESPRFHKLTSRPCTEADFETSHDRSSYGFNELDELSRSVSQDYFSMKCIEDDFEVFGDYNTYAARNLMITFEMCDSNERQCKSEVEIERALAKSYILVIEN